MSFPLDTLAAQIVPSGITAPSYNDILSSLIASFQAIYGSDVLLTPDTQDYQLLAIFALAIHDCNQTAIDVYNGFRPSYAQGAPLSSLVKINGIARNIATNSTVDVTIVGVAGTLILGGIVQDQNKNYWALPDSVTIPFGGSIIVTATAQEVGAIAAAIGTVNIIATPTLGWQTVTNANAAVIGAPIETDAELRARQTVSTGLPALTPLQSILAAVANITGVQRYAIYENPTNVVDANGLPPHSIAVIVLGGDATEIAQAIETKKSPGTATYGTTEIVVDDPAGVPVTINFFQLVLVEIYVTVTIKTQPGYVGSTANAIQHALMNFINNLPIGDTVRYNWLLSVAGLTDSLLGLSFYVTDLRAGLAPGPAGVIDIPIAFNSASATIVTQIVIVTT